MQETLSHCPVCKNNRLHEKLEIKDYSVSHELFHLAECTHCGFLFTNPRPSEKHIGKYYQSESYISHTDTSNGIINRLYHIVRWITLKQKINYINNLLPDKGKLLDLGCGTGYFLKVAQENGWRVSGVEPDEKASSLASKRTGTTIDKDFLSTTYSEKFQIVTLWHVLEHIHRLEETMLKLYEILDDNGILLIALPNHKSYDAKKYKAYWAAYDIPRHLYHFDPNTIKLFGESCGFTLKRMKGMPFDGFYVSMLSEKYKNGNMLSALTTATIGLTKALFVDQHMYSSLIYVFQKI